MVRMLVQWWLRRNIIRMFLHFRVLLGNIRHIHNMVLHINHNRVLVLECIHRVLLLVCILGNNSNKGLLRILSKLDINRKLCKLLVIHLRLLGKLLILFNLVLLLILLEPLILVPLLLLVPLVSLIHKLEPLVLLPTHKLELSTHNMDNS